MPPSPWGGREGPAKARRRVALAGGLNSRECTGVHGATKRERERERGLGKELGLHKSNNNWQTNLIAALQMPGNTKFTRAKKLKHV